MAGQDARAETNEQKGKRIVDEAVAALGGPAYLGDAEPRGIRADLRLLSREALRTGCFDSVHLIPGSAGGAGAGFGAGFMGERVRDARGKKLDDVILYIDGTGYEITFRGARPLADAVINQFRVATMHNIFYILRERLAEPGMIFESHGADFFENRPVETVEITDANNDTVTGVFRSGYKAPDMAEILPERSDR